MHSGRGRALEIVREGHPVLRQKARRVERVDQEIRDLADEMLKTMYEANGVGLAAPQVAVPLRLIVVDAGGGPLTLVNPEIIKREGESEDVEGCLSIPGLYGIVNRAAKVVVAALDRNGNPVVVSGEDLLARALQHEIDHLDGILFVDRASQVMTAEEYRRMQEEGGAE